MHRIFNAMYIFAQQFCEEIEIAKQLMLHNLCQSLISVIFVICFVSSWIVQGNLNFPAQFLCRIFMSSSFSIVFWLSLYVCWLPHVVYRVYCMKTSLWRKNNHTTSSRSTFEFPSRVNLSGPSLYCTSPWKGLAGATRLMRSDFMLHIGWRGRFAWHKEVKLPF